MSEHECVLDIVWEVEGFPRLVGPFDSVADAEGWAHTNVPNGSWMVCPLSAPYASCFMASDIPRLLDGRASR